MMRDFKLSSILIIALLLIISYYAAKYIVFPMLHLVLGLAAGILSAVITVALILLIYFYLRDAFRKKY